MSFNTVKSEICPWIWHVWQTKRKHKRSPKDDTLACLLRTYRITVNFSLVCSPLIYMKTGAIPPTLTPNTPLWRQLPDLPFSKLKVKIASLSEAAAAIERLAKELHSPAAGCCFPEITTPLSLSRVSFTTLLAATLLLLWLAQVQNTPDERPSAFLKCIHWLAFIFLYC